jgi:hypothetical protein
MTSAIHFSEEILREQPRIDVPTETDTIPRIKARDLVSVVQFLSRNNTATLESLRVKLNVDRKKPSGGTAGYAVARDVAAELDRLGLAKVGPLPKDAKGFEKKRNTVVRLVDAGSDLAEMIRTDRAGAYIHLLKGLFETHPYLRRYIYAVMRGPFLAPVVTSAKQHVSAKYGNAKALADDVAGGRFEVAALIELIANRMGRPLRADEQLEIENGVNGLVSKLQAAAAAEPQTEFARKMLMAINEVVVPAVLRREGLGFDFNSLRRMWLMGTEFQISWATSAHPRHDGWVMFDTARVELNEKQDKIEGVRFETGVRQMADGFLDRLFESYTLMHSWGQPAVVTAWELRATFCFQNRCAPRVFDHLFRENYGGSETYRIEKDFAPRSKPSHEEGLRIGGREIGLIRISKRANDA